MTALANVFNTLYTPVHQLAVSRFKESTPVQEKVIPRILKGKNILAIAGTGLGKTESAMLPIFSKMKEKEHLPIACLYITPMKSLNRDLQNRMIWWCNKLELDISIRHGDTTQYERKIQLEHPPQIMVTTPEQIQAMLIGSRFREHLRNIKYIVIDEIHEIVQSKRGVQLTVALERLKELCGEPQVIALSATVGSPELVAKFIFNKNDYEIIQIPTIKDLSLEVKCPVACEEDKKIAETAFIGENVAARLRTIHGIIKQHQSSLTFTNTREAAEILSSRLRIFDKDLAHEVHHSSLSKDVRIKAEKDFKSESLKSMICVSGDSRTLTKCGSWKEIKNLDINENIVSIDETDLKGKESISRLITNNGNRNIFELKSNLGYKIKTTNNHKFLTINEYSKIEWKELKKLKVGDPVAIFRNPIKGKQKEFLDILPDKTYVKIKENKITAIKDILKSKNITYEQLGSRISYKKSLIKSFLGEKKYSKLSIVKDVFKFLEIKLRYEDIKYVGVRNYHEFKIPKYIDPTFSRLLGFLLSDGTITGKGRIRFFNKNVKLLKEFKIYLFNKFGIHSQYKLSEDGVTTLEAEAVWLGDTLAEIGIIRGRKARILKIPTVIFELPIKHRYNFLAGYFDGDGNHESKENRLVSIIFNTYSKRAAEDIQLMLLGLGIISSLRDNSEKDKGYHVAIIGGLHLKKFIKNCKFLKINYKDFITKGGYSNIDTIYNLGNYLKHLRLKSGISTYKMQKLHGINPIRYEYRERSISRKNLAKLLNIYSKYTDIGVEITKLHNSDIFWDRIHSIKSKGSEEVYDIVDNEYNNFISNGFILHNCTSSLELGIDIGSIDVVIQYMSPRQVTKLIQRVGRSGHGLGRKSIGYIITAEGDDVFEASVIARKVLNSELEKVKTFTNCYDVLAHQIIGMLMLDYEIDVKKAYNIIKRAYPYATLKKEDFERVLKLLEDIRLIYRDKNLIKRKRRVFEYYFQNLSVIPDSRSYKIIDLNTNSFIGSLDEEFVANHNQTGSTFIMKGSSWKILSIENGKILVEPVQNIESAIPAWEGELIPVPYSIAEEVGSLRDMIRKLLDKELDKKDIVAKIKEKYPVSNQAAEKMINVIKKHIKEFELPTNNEILLESYKEYVVIHAMFGTLVNETISRYISAILSADYGEAIFSKCDPYRIIIRGCRLDDIKRVLLGYQSGDAELIVEKALPRSSLFKFRFIRVAKRMGIIDRGAEFDKINLERLIDVYYGSPLFEEAMKEVLTEKLDIVKANEVMTRIKNKEIGILETQGLSPLGETGFKFELSDIVKPNTPEKEIFNLFKGRLLNTKMRLVCINCGEYSISYQVKDIKNLICPKCESRLIAMLRDYDKESQAIIKKWLATSDMTPEEEKKLEYVKKSAELAISYGTQAAFVLAGRGVGPQTAFRILAKANLTEDELLKNILKAERDYVANKRFWTD